VHKVLKEHRVTRELKVRQAHRVVPGHKVLREQLDHRVRLEPLELKVIQVLKET
jgi:hypothetical protein